MAGGLHKYTVQEAQNAGLGQLGSIFVTGTAAATAALGVFVAITFLEDTVFDSDAEGLVAEDNELWPNSVGDADATTTKISAANGDNTDTETFPRGVTIYGRWTSFKLTSGKVIAYVG